MIENLIHRDSHPPGYQTLLYWWMNAFGKSDFIIRLPSAIAGIASVFFVYQAGKRIFSKEAGLFAAMLLAGSFPAVYYSQEARAYSLLLLFFIINIEFFFRVYIEQSRKIFDRAVLWITLTAMIYLHYAGSILMFSEAIFALFLLMKNPSKSKVIQLLTDFSIPFLLYSPWLPVMYRHATAIEYWSPKPTLNDLEVVARFVLAPSNELYYSQLIAIFLWVLLCVAIYVIGRRREETQYRNTLVCVILAVIPTAIFVLKSYVSQSIFTTRHFIYLVPLICLICGVFAASMLRAISREWVKMIILLGGLLAIFVFQVKNNIYYRLYQNNDKHDFRSAVQLLLKDDGFLQSSRMIVTSHDFFDHYLNYYDIAKSSVPYAETVQYEDVKASIARSGESYFYYMDVVLPGVETPSNILNDYTTVCRSEFNYTRVRKLSVDKNVAPSEKPCPNLP